MSLLPRRYRYQYRMDDYYGQWRYTYCLVGRWGAVHLHISEHGDQGAVQRSAGLETHYRQPPRHMDDRPPSQDECWLLRAPCWHDGTTLYAEESLLPMFDGVHHEAMFRRLAGFADETFKEFTQPEGVAT